MNEVPDSQSFLPVGAGAKLGLALSGGGFRAALFHIGILAQLAEQDLLRRVSVISTVSGGSIIGAFYFLKVKQLLEARRADDLQPDTAGFKCLVQEVEREFVDAVQQNMRVSALLDRHKNAQMLGDAYSATQRLAELFDEYFYRPITGGSTSLLQDLLINPALAVSEEGAGDEGFTVPVLVLNATALNTGRLWQFTGSFVGESESFYLSAGATPMPVLGRLSLQDPGLSAGQRNRLNRLTLGQAVASSCCVPGLLEPFNLRGLFRDELGHDVDVRLVDGGVCDNQGLVSLFDEDCTHILCSDATDLLQWQPGGIQRTVEVVMRANEIMMDRIRGELLAELFSRDGRFALFHLADEAAQQVFPVDTERLISALAKIRTDLDSFSDLEASSLMYFGFCLSGEKFSPGSSMRYFEQPDAAPVAWRFWGVQSLLLDASTRAQLLRHLEVGSRQLFKVFYLGKSLPYVILLAPLTLPLAGVVALIYFLPPIPVSAWVILGLIVASITAYSQNTKISQLMDQVPALRRFRRRLAVTLRPLGVPSLLGLYGAIGAWVQLRVFDRLFLKYGSLLVAAKSPRFKRGSRRERQQD
jgi:NTE family protein